MSYGFRKRVSSYGCCDVDGYRFHYEKYEMKKPDLSIINSGVCVTSRDEDNNVTEYFGVIEDIIKISWEGSMQLELVLFYCRWFDPTSRGVRRTEKLDLVEVKHGSSLSNFEPFVMASQVTQVYYFPYACTSKPDLKDWWIVQHVPPEDHLPPIETNGHSNQNEGPRNDISFFQENGLEGTFVIYLGMDIDINTSSTSDEITDPKDLKAIENQKNGLCEEDALPSEEEDDDDYDSDNDDEQIPKDYEAEDF